MQSERTKLRELRRHLTTVLDDEPSAVRSVASAAGVEGLLGALAQVHATAVVAADAAEDLVALSADAASAHLTAAHRAADAGLGHHDALHAHVAEVFATTAGRAQVAALRERAAWLEHLVVALDRERLDTDLESFGASRPGASGTRSRRSRVAPALLAELELARIHEAFDRGSPLRVEATRTTTSWLYVPALSHRVGAEGEGARVDEGPPVVVSLPAFFIARRAHAARDLEAATAVAARAGGALPGELAWEAAARLLGPWLDRGVRWEWCADAYDRRLLLRASFTGAHAVHAAGAWQVTRTLEAPTRRRRVLAAGPVADVGARPIRVVRREARP